MRTKGATVLAVSVVIAAVTGAVTGALAAWGIARAAPSVREAPVATIYETRALQGAITVLQEDLAALKTRTEAATKGAYRQFARVGEHSEHVPRGRTHDNTASVASLQPAAATPAQQRRPRLVAGWSVREVYLDGTAAIESRRGGTIQVAPGKKVPGIGRIEAIREQDGRWVVVTSQGLITPAR